MRFCELFIDYEIGLKNIKKSIPWTNLPMYRKVFIVMLFIAGALAILFMLLKIDLVGYMAIGVMFLILIAFTAIDATKRNLKEMLDSHYSIYSKNRMQMVITVLNKYKINISDRDTINLLIEQAEKSKVENDPFLHVKGPIKTLGAIIIPIIIYVAKNIAESSSQDEVLSLALLSVALILCVASIIFALLPILRIIFYRDLNRYEDLIYDLNQIKIFYN